MGARSPQGCLARWASTVEWGEQLGGVFMTETPSQSCSSLLSRPKLSSTQAYDSDGLDADLAQIGTLMIAPNRENRKRKTQDGRPLRRYKRRWKVERTIAWLQSFRRVRTRDEHKAQHFLGFVQLACILMLLRRISG